MTTTNKHLYNVKFPFQVGIDPMEELLVASFTGDPAFEALEPQIFEDAVNKNQIRVLRYQ